MRDVENINAWAGYASSRMIAMFTFALNYVFNIVKLKAAVETVGIGRYTNKQNEQYIYERFYIVGNVHIVMAESVS
jgi:hypothetical protein